MVETDAGKPVGPEVVETNEMVDPSSRSSKKTVNESSKPNPLKYRELKVPGVGLDSGLSGVCLQG